MRTSSRSSSIPLSGVCSVVAPAAGNGSPDTGDCGCAVRAGEVARDSPAGARNKSNSPPWLVRTAPYGSSSTMVLSGCVDAMVLLQAQGLQ